jgi:AcrR family transcriptional regulator
LSSTRAIVRVTAQTKSATRKRILQAARRLFADDGFEATTTRDIALAADIASGTLFNYFPTKEAIVAALANDAIGDALAPPADAPQHQADTLEEDLFALVAACLRKLKPLRKHLPSLFETSLSPLAAAGGANASQHDATSFRVRQLQAVAAIAAEHGFVPLSAIAMQLYWTLYIGVLLFWAADASAKQEETLALIDDSLNMFVGWLREQGKSNSTPSIRR